MAVPYFELLTGAELLERRDYPIGDATILDPMTANPLIEGEWLELNASRQLVRGAANTESKNPYMGQFWGERGRYDIRAISKVPILLWGNYEAYTKVFHNPGVADANTPQTLGDRLAVMDVTVDGIGPKRGLKVPTANGHHWVVAYYYGPGRTTGEMRYMRREPYDLLLP